jgi:hypothetical protein
LLPLLERRDVEDDFLAGAFLVGAFLAGAFLAEDDDRVEVRREPVFFAASRLASRAAIRSTTLDCSSGSSSTTISSPAAFYFR